MSERETVGLAELARLRAVEAAARAVVEGYSINDYPEPLQIALRNAVNAPVGAPSVGTRVSVDGGALTDEIERDQYGGRSGTIVAYDIEGMAVVSFATGPQLPFALDELRLPGMETP